MEMDKTRQSLWGRGGGEQGNHKEPRNLRDRRSQPKKQRRNSEKNQEENWKERGSQKHQKRETRKAEPGIFGNDQLCP